jgi:hypothetical protein
MGCENRAAYNKPSKVYTHVPIKRQLTRPCRVSVKYFQQTLDTTQIIPLKNTQDGLQERCASLVRQAMMQTRLPEGPSRVRRKWQKLMLRWVTWDSLLHVFVQGWKFRPHTLINFPRVTQTDMHAHSLTKTIHPLHPTPLQMRATVLTFIWKRSENQDTELTMNVFVYSKITCLVYSWVRKAAHINLENVNYDQWGWEVGGGGGISKRMRAVA